VRENILSLVSGVDRAVRLSDLRNLNGPVGDEMTDKLPAEIKRQIASKMYADPIHLLGYCVKKNLEGLFMTSPRSRAIVQIHPNGQTGGPHTFSGYGEYVPSFWVALKNGETSSEFSFRIDGDSLLAVGPDTSLPCAFMVVLVAVT
jgi:hypothetical protein